MYDTGFYEVTLYRARMFKYSCVIYGFVFENENVGELPDAQISQCHKNDQYTNCNDYFI